MVLREGTTLWRNCNNGVTTFVIVLYNFKKVFFNNFHLMQNLTTLATTQPDIDKNVYMIELLYAISKLFVSSFFGQSVVGHQLFIKF